MAGFLGNQPSQVPLTSADIADGTITNDDLAGSITDAKISALAASKLTGTVADSQIAAMSSSKLTGDLPAISGANLTGLASTPYLHTVQTHVIVASSQAIAAGTYTNITNLNATITPTSGTNILITVRWSGEFTRPNTEDTVFGIRRDSTIVGNPAAAGSRIVGIAPIATGYPASEATSTPDSCFYQYLDSPSTGSAIVYHATIRNNNAQTIYNNRTVSDSDTNNFERLTSTITLQEVVAP